MTLSDYDRLNVGPILRGHGTWFTADLLRLIAHADAANRERLRLAFTDVVEAFEAWERSPEAVEPR